MRTGDEPRNARSPLRLRLGLAGFGLGTALIAAFAVRPVASLWVSLLFGAVAVIAALDLVAVARRLRQGPHYQPGPDVPPYRPVDPEPRPRARRAVVSERVRIRRYLTLMGICVTLIAVAWFGVRLYSTTLAVALSMVAAILPPIAVFIANFGVQMPTDAPDADRPDRPEPRG